MIDKTLVTALIWYAQSLSSPGRVRDPNLGSKRYPTFVHMCRLRLSAAPRNSQRSIELQSEAEVEFAIINPIRKLIILAAELCELKGIPVSQWKRRVLTFAEEKYDQKR